MRRFSQSRVNGTHRFSGTLDVIATAVFIVVCVVVGLRLTEQIWRGSVDRATSGRADGGAAAAAPKLNRSEAVVRPAGYRVGDKLTWPGLVVTQRTLVVVVRAGCRYCDASMAFYREAAAGRAGQMPYHFVVVSPDSTEATGEYFAAAGIRPDAVLSAPLEQLRVRGTPTLLVVDVNGVVQNSWLGQLNTRQEKEVLDVVNGGLNRSPSVARQGGGHDL